MFRGLADAIRTCKRHSATAKLWVWYQCYGFALAKGHFGCETNAELQWMDFRCCRNLSIYKWSTFACRKDLFRIAIYSFDMSEGSEFPRFNAEVLSQVFRANEWASVLGLVSSAGAKAHSQAAEDDPMFDIAGDLLPTDFADSGIDSMETDSIPDSGMTSEYLYTSPESSEAISTETDSISSDGMTSEYHYMSSESG